MSIVKSNAPRSNTKIPRGERKRKVVIFYSILRIWEGVTPRRGVIRFFSDSCAFFKLFRSRSLECHAWPPPINEKGMQLVCMHPLAKEQLQRGLTFSQANGVLARDKRKLFPISSILRQALFASSLKPQREYATRHKLLKPISELLGHFIVSKNKFFRCLRKLEFLSGQAVTQLGFYKGVFKETIFYAAYVTQLKPLLYYMYYNDQQMEYPALKEILIRILRIRAFS